jgi:S-adenosylmethionine hydrolase
LPKIITLTTDFGLKDPYVAEMKATILSICPTAAIVDLTHEIDKFNVRMGAYMLASAVPYFPKGTIHVAVVDPDVGTERRPLLIQTKQGFFLGPDNGLLVLASEKQGVVVAREITKRKLMLPEVSSTFHGRDLFAPVAAHLATGLSPSKVGPEVKNLIKPVFAKIRRLGNELEGEVLYVDGFGNVITNVSNQEIADLHLGDTVALELHDCMLKLSIGKTYGETKLKQPLALIGSHGYLEISVNQGNAAELFKAKIGDKIRFTKP